MVLSSIVASATTGREGNATPDPSSTAPPPAPAPPPLPASKRRWSPCTWRYAIEEAQADLPSRSRSTTIAAANAGSGAHPSTSSRLASHHPQQQHPHPIKAKLPPHHNPPVSKSDESAPQRNSSHHVPSRGHPPSTESHMRPSVHAPLKSSTTELLPKKILQHELLFAKASQVSEKEEDKEKNDADQEDTSEDADDDNGKAVLFDEEYFKRRRREMSPSELYFCADCTAAKGRIKLLNDQS